MPQPPDAAELVDAGIRLAARLARREHQPEDASEHLDRLYCDAARLLRRLADALAAQRAHTARLAVLLRKTVGHLEEQGWRTKNLRAEIDAALKETPHADDT